MNSGNFESFLEPRAEHLKLYATKWLSRGLSSVATILLLIVIGGILLLSLVFALTLFIGEAIGSYALAALYVSGGVAVLFLLLWLLRKHLFRSTLIAVFSDAFFDGKKKVRNARELENELLKNELRIEKSNHSLFVEPLKYLLKKIF